MLTVFLWTAKHPVHPRHVPTWCQSLPQLSSYDVCSYVVYMTYMQSGQILNTRTLLQMIAWIKSWVCSKYLCSTSSNMWDHSDPSSRFNQMRCDASKHSNKNDPSTSWCTYCHMKATTKPKRHQETQAPPRKLLLDPS